PSSSKSSTSILSARDWQRIKKLLKKTVCNIHNKNSQKLYQTINHLTTENVLLKLKTKGLANALFIEQKRRQRSKPLHLELRAPEIGMAIFYSPNKVQQARDRAREKEEAVRITREEKKKEKLRKEEEKAENKRLLEERKAAQAIERRERAAEKALKQIKKEEAKFARKARRQLKNDSKQMKDKRKKAIKTIVIESDEEIESASPDEVVEATSVQTRRGRKIVLPQRFCN
ncbi:hypothetical protein K469DRAFT_196271, partial [Zopfia rhizophila CBS 207.26]